MLGSAGETGVKLLGECRGADGSIVRIQRLSLEIILLAVICIESSFSGERYPSLLFGGEAQRKAFVCRAASSSSFSS